MARHLKRRDLFALAAGAAAWPAVARGKADGDEIAPADRVEMARIAADFCKDNEVPGLAVAIARNGRVAYREGFGLANQNNAEPVTPAHLFRIASISKTITAVAIFALIEQGHVTLGDTVFGSNGVLKFDYGRPPYQPFVENLTIEHLLTHTAGGWSNSANDPMFSHPRMSQQLLIAWTLVNVPLTRPPGSSYAYSNFGYCVLGRVIEKVTGRGYADFVRDAVLKRCNITDMRIAGNTLAERAPGEVVYYDTAGDPYGMNVARMDSHGGWIGSADDLVRFALNLESVLKPASIATMMTPSTANANYAKGWAVNRRGNWWHNGSLPGTSTIMVRTSSSFCWAALANSRRATPDSVQALDRMMWNMVRAVKGWAP